MDEHFVAYAQASSIVAALLLLGICWRWPTAGRALFALIFLWAGPWNLYTVWSEPEVYLNYARWAVPDITVEFILGNFSRHIAGYVTSIALGQIAIGLMVSAAGRWVKRGLFGAIVFLLAITPLGIGSGFPFTLITAGSALLLWRREHRASLPALAWAWFRGWRAIA